MVGQLVHYKLISLRNIITQQVYSGMDFNNFSSVTLHLDKYTEQVQYLT